MLVIYKYHSKISPEYASINLWMKIQRLPLMVILNVDMDDSVEGCVLQMVLDSLCDY